MWGVVFVLPYLHQQVQERLGKSPVVCRATGKDGCNLLGAEIDLAYMTVGVVTSAWAFGSLKRPQRTSFSPKIFFLSAIFSPSIVRNLLSFCQPGFKKPGVQDVQNMFLLLKLQHRCSVSEWSSVKR
jgi:hypothetical protein